MSKTIRELQKQVHETALEKGWWDKPRDFGEIIANIHGEVSEAWEEYRAGIALNDIYYDSTGKPCGVVIEAADTVIRWMDFLEHIGADLQEAIEIKAAYNETRPHRHGGKLA